jgi:hypothetical protein
MNAIGLAIILSVLAVAYAERPLGLLAAIEPESEVSPVLAQMAPAPAMEMFAETAFLAQASPPELEVTALELVPEATPEPALPAPAPAPPRAPMAPTATPIPSGVDLLVRALIHNVNITFYDCLNDGFCGAMYNGQRVYEGAAACSWNLPIGTKFRILGDPTARVYRCDDRGWLANTWVDISFYDPADGWRWQAQVGRYGTIEIVEIPGR